MGLNVQALGISLPSLTGEVQSVLDKQVNYALAAPTKLVGEGIGKLQSTFGASLPFTKITSLLPGLDPAAPELVPPAASIKAATESSDPANTSSEHKVRLSTSDLDAPVVVEFDLMPEVQETHAADYEPLSAPQMPTEFQKYRGTKSIQWRINGTFICRTREEARRNYVYLNTLRGWTKPYFGEKQRRQFPGKLGAPPPVLNFSGWRGLVGKVPVVITNVDWNFPKDCDWIPTGIVGTDGKEIPFPTVMTVNVSMVESFSANQVNGFDLVQFRAGQMVNAWSGMTTQPAAPPVAEAMGSNGGNQSVVNGTPQPSGDEPSSTTNENPTETRRYGTSRVSEEQSTPTLVSHDLPPSL